MARKRNHRRGEAHVRLYRHELESPAYRSLCLAARALLVEMRALYNGTENRIHMSVREAMRRLGCGRWTAQNALDELVDRGFVAVLERGSFTRKVRHATVYRLTSEPADPTKDGATPTKDYMSWTPPEKNTVSVTSTDGVSHQHRGAPKQVGNGLHGVGDQHRNDPFSPSHGVGDQHTDKLPGCSGVGGVS